MRFTRFAHGQWKFCGVNFRKWPTKITNHTKTPNLGSWLKRGIFWVMCFDLGKWYSWKMILLEIAYLWQGWLWSLSLLIFSYDCIVQDALQGQLICILHFILCWWVFPPQWSFSLGEGGLHFARGYGPPKFVSFWPPGSAWAGGRVLPCIAMTTVLQSGHPI